VSDAHPDGTTRRRGRAATAAPARRLADRAATLWACAVVLFVGGDLATTLVGLRLAAVTETAPVAAAAVAAYGFGSLVALKLATVGVAGAAWRLAPDPASAGIPLGLAALGGVVSAWNVRVLLAAAVAGG